MKKLITLLFITTLFSSCGRKAADFRQGIVIQDIESHYGACIYYTTTTIWSGGNPFELTNAYFFDSCGKFNVGDTIILTKK